MVSSIGQELSLSRPLPQSNPRHHAHSISLGAVNANHRVTRRKSVTTAAAANAAAAAVAASLKDSAGESVGVSMPPHRRGSRKGLESSSVGAPSGFGSYLSRSMNSPSHEPPVARKASPTDSNDASSTNLANVDGNSSANRSANNNKNRNRRASEGSHLIKGEGKRPMTELRCDRCGKGYKHGSCLSKHMCVSSPSMPSCRLARSGVNAPCRLCARSPSWSFSSPHSPNPFPSPVVLGHTRLTFNGT